MLRILTETLSKRIRKRYRGVSTWSPLATAFNSKVSSDLGFSLSQKKSVSRFMKLILLRKLFIVRVNNFRIFVGLVRSAGT